MKKLCTVLITAVIMSFGLVSESNAQVIDVTVNPIPLLFGNVNVGAEYVVNDNIGVELTIGIASGKDEVETGDAEAKYFGMPVAIFGKYYFGPDDGADRFYADIWLKYVNRKYEYSGTDADLYAGYTSTRFGVGFGIGYKLVADNGLVFDVGFGGGRAIVDDTEFETSAGEQTAFDLPGIMTTGKIGIGYRFGN